MQERLARNQSAHLGLSCRKHDAPVEAVIEAVSMPRGLSHVSNHELSKTHCASACHCDNTDAGMAV